MEVVLAGSIAGYIMALLSTAALTYLVFSAKDPGRLSNWLPENRALSAVPFSVGTTLVWTMAGLVLASAYRVLGAAEQRDFAGNPSLPWLLGMVGLAAMPLPFLALVWRRHWWLFAAMSGAFLGLFGLLMPVLAGN